MKIVCDACAAKYSIADDKVKGKVFKIRCKKCSNIIVVRGTGGAADEPAAGPYDQKETRVYDYGSQDAGAAPPADDAVWHVVIDQEQIGPISVADVQARFAAGELDVESYVWREGFADWLPLSAAVDLVRPMFLDQWPDNPWRHAAVLALYAVASFWAALAFTRQRFRR